MSTTTLEAPTTEKKSAAKKPAKKPVKKEPKFTVDPAGPMWLDQDGQPWIFLPFFTSNIGRGVTQAKAKTNITKVMNQGFLLDPWNGDTKVWGVKGFQEIDEADAAREHDILGQFRKGKVEKGAEHDVLLKAKWHQSGSPLYTFGGFAQATPIAVPAPWTIEDVIVTLTTKGKAKVSPHRVCVQVEMKHPLMDHSIWALDGHYPYKWPEGWGVCQRKWTDIVARHQQAGHTMVTMRDVNQHGRMPALHTTEKQLLPGTGIDKISLIPGGVEAKKTRGKPKVIDTNIDGHDAKGVGLTFAV